MKQSDIDCPRSGQLVLVLDERKNWRMISVHKVDELFALAASAGRVAEGPGLFLRWHTGDTRFKSGPVLLDASGGVGLVWAMEPVMQGSLYTAAPLAPRGLESAPDPEMA